MSTWGVGKWEKESKSKREARERILCWLKKIHRLVVVIWIEGSQPIISDMGFLL